MVSPIDISSIPLYSGTVFTLTCVVMVPEVDTTVTVLTSWYKNDVIIATTDRISVDNTAQSINDIVYESDVVFNPLSNMASGGDTGDYTCSARVQDDDYITSNSSSATQAIAVEGQYIIITRYGSTLYIGIAMVVPILQYTRKRLK